MAGGMHGIGGMCGRGHAWQGVCMAGGMCGGGGVAGEITTTADGMHPTGMHSYLIILSLIDKHLLSEEPITSRAC